jgi:hypothetical protein
MSNTERRYEDVPVGAWRVGKEKEEKSKTTVVERAGNDGRSILPSKGSGAPSAGR